jgi:hypothetical protein
LCLAISAFPLKGSLVDMDYAENARNDILNSSVIYLFVSSCRVVVCCLHGDYMGCDKSGIHLWLILRK